MKQVIAFVLSLAALCGVSHAQLVWEKKEISVKAKTSEAAAVVEFPFTNKGTKPVTITALKPTCDCSSADADKMTIKPGESGTVTATFEFGSRAGTERKTFRVMTNDPESNVELALTVDIPQTLEFSPQFVTWSPEEAGTAKPVEFTILAPEAVHITGVKSTNPKVTSEVKTIEDGKKYQVLLTVPAGSVPPLESVVTVQTDYPSLNPRTYQVFARVMKVRGKKS